jgi:hypothetical protein
LTGEQLVENVIAVGPIRPGRFARQLMKQVAVGRKNWPFVGSVAHGNRAWYLAKECVGSDRALIRTIATSRSDDNQNESQDKLFGR